MHIVYVYCSEPFKQPHIQVNFANLNSQSEILLPESDRFCFHAASVLGLPFNWANNVKPNTLLYCPPTRAVINKISV